MSIRIIQQPNGKFAAYSSVVEDFLVEDATEEGLEEWYLERQEERARGTIRSKVEKAEEGSYKTPGPTTYEEAKQRADRY